MFLPDERQQDWWASKQQNRLPDWQQNPLIGMGLQALLKQLPGLKGLGQLLGSGNQPNPMMQYPNQMPRFGSPYGHEGREGARGRRDGRIYESEVY